MAKPPPPPITLSGPVSGPKNPYRSTTDTPTIYNSSTDPVEYNGFKWSFSTNVSWGRFISGEPFIITPAAGVLVTGVSYSDSRGLFNCPALVTGFTGLTQQSQGIGATLWINGSMKNPKPFWEVREFLWNGTALGATVFPWNYDERLSAGVANRIGRRPMNGLSSFDNSMSDFLFFPVGISSGDNLVTAKSSFDGDHTKLVKPQVTNKYCSWTDPDMSRMVIEKYGILTALSSVPTYSDCYRPPVFWNGLSLANRPIFYKRDMVKNTEDYVIDTPTKNIFGEDINVNTDPPIQVQTISWNNFVNSMWISTHIPYYSGISHQLAISAYDLYNSDPSTEKGGYMGGGAKVKDQILHSIFAPWVTPTNRQKALDKVTQFCIDCWGTPNAKGIASGDGGYHAAVHHPWVIFLGWLYGRNDMTKYYLGQQIQERLAPGITGIWNTVKSRVPNETFYKSFLTQDYGQRSIMYGAGVTQLNGNTAWVATNPDIKLYHGATSASTRVGSTGYGWMYKISGISAAYSYTSSSVKLSGQLISGSFGTIVLHKNTVFRLNGLGPNGTDNGPATYPPFLDSNGRLLRKVFDTSKDCGAFWSFDEGAVMGWKVKIISGPGAGNTAYTVLQATNTFVRRGTIQDEDIEDQNPANNLGALNVLKYPSLTLERDFDGVAPTQESVIDLYPFEKDEVSYNFSSGGWASSIGLIGLTQYGGDTTSILSQVSYNNIADEAIIKNYAIHNLLGITEDQFMIDYVKNVYFNPNTLHHTRRQKVTGSAYVGSIFSTSNSLEGALLAKSYGLSGNEYVPRNITNLPGMFDNQPAVSLDGINIDFIPQLISGYSVPGGSGVTYSGYGIVFDSPQSVLQITAIIDDKIFVVQNQPGLYRLLADLKVKFGPFITNSIVVESREDESEFIDKVGYYDFGSNRSPNDISLISTSDKMIKRTPKFSVLANTNKQVKLSFVTSTYSMGGAAGVLPDKGHTYTYKLATSNGPGIIKRDISDNIYITLGDNSQPLDDIWVCIASPRISSDILGAEEYDYNNWKPVSIGAADLATLLSEWGTEGSDGTDLDGDGVVGASDLAILLTNYNRLVSDGTGYRFNASNLSFPSGNQGICYGTGTDDKLIFFRYLVNSNTSLVPWQSHSIPSPLGSTGIPLNNSNYAGWNNSDIVKVHKINQVTVGNSPGNSGYFRYSFNNSNSTNDYRRLAYNHFRLWNNNYFELENTNEFPTFDTFIDGPFGPENSSYYGKRFAYNGAFNNFLFDGVTANYFMPKAEDITITISNTDDNTLGFYTQYIHGQTMELFLPSSPHTLLWCTGATS